MKHLKKFNESIEVDWSKSYKEIERSVLNEINRIFYKTKSGVWKSSFSKEDLEWSDTPSVDYEYKDGKLVKVGEKKVFLRLSKSIREELNILEEIEEIYDDLNEKFMEIIDMLNFEASFELSWDYGPKFKEREYVNFKVTFDFEKLDMPSYGKSLQNISSLIGNENITSWTNSDITLSLVKPKCSVYFRHKK